MKTSIYLNISLLMAVSSYAAPVRRNINLDTRAETADADDRVVYAWAVPEAKDKRTETADADDRVVYAWAVPKEKDKRAEEADADDKVVYAWAVPE